MYYAEIEEEEDDKANIEMIAAALEIPTEAATETISWPSPSQLATPQTDIYDEQ